MTNHPNNNIDQRSLCDASHCCEPGLHSISHLCQVKADDVMHGNVHHVHENWSITALAKFFIKHRISGAPVINGESNLVGVVSATDIFQFENIPHAEKIEITRHSYYCESLGEQLSEDDLAKLSEHAEDNCTVDSIMTPEVISVQRDAALPSIARLMSRRHIHRVFVTESDVVVGVISTTDLLQAIGNVCP